MTLLNENKKLIEAMKEMSTKVGNNNNNNINIQVFLNEKCKDALNITDFMNSLQITLDDLNITTVCEEAACPNIGNCWEKKHATMMIMGDICTRACSFCNVATGKPKLLDPSEPVRVAQSVLRLNLKHVVITSVDRDDLNDGGASHFVNTISSIREISPQTSIEILTPDFLRKDRALEKVI